jgi:hypothetical protein
MSDMQALNIHRAPWSPLLVILSALPSALCVAVAVVMLGSSDGLVPWLGLLPLAIPLGGALFTIRGYRVAPRTLLIRRLLWETRVPLAGLRSATFEPDAMRRSWRLCGNGGLFSFTGLYRNKTLGNYRAFVTDPRRVVVLRFATRTVVVSPAEPEEFVRQVGDAALL